MKAHHRLEALAENIGQQKFSQGLVSSFLVYNLLELHNKQRHVGMAFPKSSSGWLAGQGTHLIHDANAGAREVTLHASLCHNGNIRVPRDLVVVQPVAHA
jgi:hypothetical protein